MKNKKSSRKDSKSWAIFSVAGLSRPLLWQLFTICLLPVQVWAVVILLRELPVLFLRLPIWDLVGVVAYIEAFALLETVIIWLILLFLAVTLPGRWLRDHIVFQGTLFVLLSSLWALALHFKFEAFWAISLSFKMAWLVTYLVSIGLLSYYARLSQRLEQWVLIFVARLEPLAALYLFLAVSGAIVMVVRNLF